MTLKKKIPSFELAFAGGGWRSLKFRAVAERMNLAAGERFVHVLGTQTDPQPWFEWSSLVCAGSTSAAEAVLANRPVVAFTAWWLGFITPEKIDEALSSYFAERKGPVRVKENLDVISEEIVSIYRLWDEAGIGEVVSSIRSLVKPHFEEKDAAGRFERVFSRLES